MPVKANHRHLYEPVVLVYFNKNKNFSAAAGFTGGIDSCGGRRCAICSRLKLGFPSDFGESANLAFFHGIDGDLQTRYPILPEVPVENIWKL